MIGFGPATNFISYTTPPMSETSSPSLSTLPFSPYSLDSLNSPADSAPRSDPTSDEEPDLGFNQVLRELPHLQPSHRIPIQIRSATSSTTPTYHAESVTSSDVRSRSQRSRATRTSVNAASSTLSSFTRPPTSSMQPDGSTVWDHPRIASYLFGLGGTPSNVQSIQEDEEEEEETTNNRYSLSPASRSSTPRTVEIADEHDVPEDQSQDLQGLRQDRSPETTTTIPVTVAVEGDSRATPHTEDDGLEIDSLSNRQEQSSLTSRDPRPPLQEEQTVTSPSSQDYEFSDPDMQMRSRPAPPTTFSSVTLSSTSSVSLPSYDEDSGVTIPIAGRSSTNSFITTSAETATSTTTATTTTETTSTDDSASTLMNIVRFRARNPPLSSNAVSESACTGTATGRPSSRISLISYQLPEMSPSARVIYEDSEPDQLQPEYSTPRHANTLISHSLSGSESASMLTQKSYLSGSGTTRRYVSTVSSSQPTDFNPPSLFPSIEVALSTADPIDTRVINELGTPDQPPSESILFDPPRRIFGPIRDDEDEPSPNIPQTSEIRFTGIVGPESSSSLSSSMHTSTSADLQCSDSTVTGSARYITTNDRVEGEIDADALRYAYSQRHISGRTPRGIPGPSTGVVIARTRLTNEEPPSTSVSMTYSFLERQFGAPSRSSYTSLGTENGSTATTFGTTESEKTLGSRSDTIVAPYSSSQPLAESSVNAYHHHHQTATQLPHDFASQSGFPILTSHPQRHVPHYSHEASIGLHLLPSDPLTFGGFEHPSSSNNNGSGGSNNIPPLESDPLHSFQLYSAPGANAGGSDWEAEQLHAEAEDSQTRFFPSLGYLDEALSFIVAERAKWSASRESVGSNAIGSGMLRGERAREQEEGEEDRGENRNEMRKGHVIDADKERLEGLGGEQTKRKRRRKKSSKHHQPITVPIAPMEVLAHDGFAAEGDAAATSGIGKGSRHRLPGSSPRKRRSKSAAPSLSLSVSGGGHSVVTSEKSGTMTPGRALLSQRRGKDFLVPPPAGPAAASGSDKKKQILPSAIVPIDSDFDDDGMRTPTTTNLLGGSNKAVVVPGILNLSNTGLFTKINLTGTKGKRVGRLEREREKLKFDKMMMKFQSGCSNPHHSATSSSRSKVDSPGDGDALEPDGEFDIGAEYEDDGTDNVDEDDRKEDDGEGEGEDTEPDGLGENDSISNMSLLQPPRKKRFGRTEGEDIMDRPLVVDIVNHDNDMSVCPNGTTRTSFMGQISTIHGHGHPTGITDEGEDVFLSNLNTAFVGVEKEKEKKKRVRTKRTKLSISQSGPDSVDGAKVPDGDGTESSKTKEFEGNGMTSGNNDRNIMGASSSKSQNDGGVEKKLPPPGSKRRRVLSLAQNLQQSFPEQRNELARVIKRIMKSDKDKVIMKAVADVVDGSGPGESPASVKSTLIPVPGKGKHKSDAKASSEGVSASDELDTDDVKTKEAMTDGEVEEPDDEEVDPRGRVPKKKDPLIHVFIDHSNMLIGLLSHLKRAASSHKHIYLARRKPLPAVINPATTICTTHGKANPAAALAAVKAPTSRPLPVVPNNNIAQPIDSPIPLPSFATLPNSRSFSSTSILTSNKKDANSHSSEELEHQRLTNSDGYNGSGMEDIDDIDDSLPQDSLTLQGGKKMHSKHLWHASLALILERGRPVTRRVVVASSPLYQPMESIERLGYELRVFIRVPDLGDGIDRERQRDRAGARSSSTASPAKISHVKRISGNTSAESGSASGGGSSSLRAYYNSTSSSPEKVKYREQGVDELLQLKLHQAIAASDIVPDGSTIVLATGDGNIGQFNEEGFLGPIRTALRRGWRVELYAWEDGLSRAWRREFGDATEWGKRGMFRIIGMEQFASWLVESSPWT